MLENKIILITNVLHFVGKPATTAMLAEGAMIICHDAEFIDDAIRNKFEADYPGASTTSSQDPNEIVKAIEAKHGQLDVLINNDAFPALRAAIDEADLDDFRDTLEALMVQGFAFAKVAASGMKGRRSGKILFVSSAAPKHGLPNYSMYCAARGGANALTVSLAKELGKFNIQVNALAPNFVESPTYFPDELLANGAAMKKITSQIPIGRLGKPEEAGAYLAFLASDKADFITGQILYFSGGWA